MKDEPNNNINDKKPDAMDATAWARKILDAAGHAEGNYYNQTHYKPADERHDEPEIIAPFGFAFVLTSPAGPTDVKNKNHNKNNAYMGGGAPMECGECGPIL